MLLQKDCRAPRSVILLLSLPILCGAQSNAANAKNACAVARFSTVRVKEAETIRPPRGDGAAELLPLGGGFSERSTERCGQQQAAGGNRGKQRQEVCGDDTHFGVPSLESHLYAVIPFASAAGNGVRNEITQVRKLLVLLRKMQRRADCLGLAILEICRLGAGGMERGRPPAGLMAR
jgi:hypothetical protein